MSYTADAENIDQQLRQSAEMINAIQSGLDQLEAKDTKYIAS